MAELTLNRLELSRGGWVEFNDPEAVRGKDIDRLRAQWQGTRVIGEALNVSMQVGAEILIARWDIPSLPGAPTPGDEPKFWGELGWRDKQAIEAHIAPVVTALCGFTPGTIAVTGSPQTPDSE